VGGFATYRSYLLFKPSPLRSKPIRFLSEGQKLFPMRTILIAITIIAGVIMYTGNQSEQIRALNNKYKLQSQMLQWAVRINEKGRRNPKIQIQQLIDEAHHFKFEQEVFARVVKTGEYNDIYGENSDFLIEAPGFVVYGDGHVRSTNLREWSSNPLKKHQGTRMEKMSK
jgi:hypothetical protein